MLKISKSGFARDLTPLDILAMPADAEIHVIAEAKTNLLLEANKETLSDRMKSNALWESGRNGFTRILDLELFDYIGNMVAD